MKKNYFMLALASMMMAACANNDLVDEGVVKEEVPQAIGFDAFANKTTRAEMDNNLTELKRTGFKVWGYKSHDTYTYTVFNGVSVTWRVDGNSSQWGYDNTQYWDQTATYDFYAVAPTDDKSSIANGKITIKDVQSSIAANSKDYLIDRAGNTNIQGSAKETQSFDFNHIMAKLSFVLEAAAEIEEPITVTSLKMTGWNNAEGTFTQSLIQTPQSTSHNEWELETPAADGVFEIVSSNLPIASSGTKVANEYIVVPQTIKYTAPVAATDANAGTPESGLTFTISYVIGTDVTKGEVFTEQVGIVPEDQIWGTDTHTTYTIIVGPAAIKFNVSSVAGWKTANGSTTID